jgi:hypothetical protein
MVGVVSEDNPVRDATSMRQSGCIPNGMPFSSVEYFFYQPIIPNGMQAW